MMSASRRRGVVWNMLGSTMFGASSMLLLMFVSRAAGKAAAGVFSVAFSTAQILYMVGLFGANHFQMTDYAGSYRFADYRALKLFSSGLMLLGVPFSALILGFRGQKLLLTALLTLYMLVCSAGELYQSLFFQQDRLDRSGQSVFWRTLLATAAFALVALVFRSTVYASVALIVCALAGYFAFAVRPSRAFLTSEGTRERATKLPALIRDCAPLFVSVVLMDALIVVPKYAVDFYLDDAVVGAYSMIFMPAQLINLFCSFIFRPALKTVSDILQANELKKLGRLMGNMALVVAGVTLLAAGACWLFGAQVLSWFYKTDLMAYRVQLAFVVLGSGLFAYSHLIYYVLIVLRKQNRLLVNYALGMLLSAALAYPLTKAFGVNGAILAFGFTHVALIALHGCGLLRALKAVSGKKGEEKDHAV